MDMNLCGDPFLIYDDTNPSRAGAHDPILDFFGTVFGLVRDSLPAETKVAHARTMRIR